MMVFDIQKVNMTLFFALQNTFDDLPYSREAKGGHPTTLVNVFAPGRNCTSNRPCSMLVVHAMCELTFDKPTTWPCENAS